MDDLEFRRKLYAEPRQQSKAVLDAIADDASKAKFADEIIQLDQQIEATMKVPVPENLAERLILRQSMESHRRQKRKSRINLAIAASIAFAVGLTINFVNFSPAHSTLVEYSLAHVYHEQEYLSDVEGSVALSKVNYKLEPYQAKLTSLAQKVLFAEHCRFDGIKGLHLVLQGENGQVTVFVMPTERLQAEDGSFTDGKLNGISSTHGAMQLVVIGEPDEPIEKVSEEIQQQMLWSI